MERKGLAVYDLVKDFPEMCMPAQSNRDLHERLSSAIERWAQGEEVRQTALQSLVFFRREEPTGPCACQVEPSVVLVVQGAKQLFIGDQVYTYDAQRFLITALDLPAHSQVLEASPNKPCLGLVMRLNLRLMADLITQSGLPVPQRDRAADGSAALGAITPSLLEPFSRLVALLDEPDALGVLAPLIEREIHYRLLTSDMAARLWQIASVGSQSHRIAKVIDWLKSHYDQPLKIDDLAAQAQMSASTLHHHFRQLTAMSPLQYQKWLRLSEARRLMLNERLDAASAAYRVGYESPSQFSREYSRTFGAPPKRDIEEVRRKASSPEEMDAFGG